MIVWQQERVIRCDREHASAGPLEAVIEDGVLMVSADVDGLGGPENARTLGALLLEAGEAWLDMLEIEQGKVVSIDGAD